MEIHSIVNAKQTACHLNSQNADIQKIEDRSKLWPKFWLRNFKKTLLTCGYEECPSLHPAEESEGTSSELPALCLWIIVQYLQIILDSYTILTDIFCIENVTVQGKSWKTMTYGIQMK